MGIWGNNPKNRKECEIDIVADNKESALFAECKWTREDVGIEVLDTLVERSELFRYARKFYYLFAKAGFSSDIQSRAAQMDNVSLVCFEEMVL